MSSGPTGAADAAPSSGAPAAAEPTTNALPAFRFPLGEQPLRLAEGGTAREASAANFPVSQGIAGVLMTLVPGGLRELHWHANAAEWAYVIAGRCRVTVYDTQGACEIADFGPGDVWYFPRGHGHSIQGLGPGECKFMLVFDNGYFSEFATFSFSDWLAQTPAEVVAKTLRLSEATIARLPKQEVYIATGPVPEPLPDDPPSGSQHAPALTHRYRLLAQAPRSFAGGELRIVSAKEFPISATMTGALLTLKPGAIRELHWHPNADEWQYVLEGNARMTVFASSGRAETVELGAGDVGYAPQGYGHYLENAGDSDCRLLLVFNSGEYQEIGLSGWIASNPRRLLATNLELAEQDLAELPASETFIVE